MRKVARTEIRAIGWLSTHWSFIFHEKLLEGKTMCMEYCCGEDIT
jgi:hypothetical protein